MTVWVGFNADGDPYERDPRYAGETKYPLRKMLRFSLDAIASFSHLPLQIATYLGFLFAGRRVHRDPHRHHPALHRRLPAGLRLDHDHDPDDRRPPADRARPDRRVRRAHLRRGQASPALHRARAAPGGSRRSTSCTTSRMRCPPSCTTRSSPIQPLASRCRSGDSGESQRTGAARDRPPPHPR